MQQTKAQKAAQTMQQTKAQKAHTQRAIAAADDLHSTVLHVMRVLAAYAERYSSVYITDTKNSAAAAIVLAEYAEKAAELLELHAHDVLHSDCYESTTDYTD